MLAAVRRRLRVLYQACIQALLANARANTGTLARTNKHAYTQ